MFGCIVPGRAVQITEWTQIDETHFTLAIPSISSVNHLTVFLTTPLPTTPTTELAATIHLQLPRQPSWILLGMLSNDKPSAVFRISGLKPANTTTTGTLFPMAANQQLLQIEATPALVDTAQLGISIEPISVALSQQLQLKQQQVPLKPAINHGETQIRLVATTEKLLENLSNYVMSFGTVRSAVDGQECVPVRVFNDWLVSVRRKLVSDPSFVSSLAQANPNP